MAVILFFHVLTTERPNTTQKMLKALTQKMLYKYDKWRQYHFHPKYLYVHYIGIIVETKLKIFTREVISSSVIFV